MSIGTGDGPPDLEAAIRLAERFDFVFTHRRRSSARRLEGDARNVEASRGVGAASQSAGGRRNRPRLSLRQLASRRAARGLHRAAGDRRARRQADRDPHARSLGRHSMRCSRSIGRPSAAASCTASRADRSKPSDASTSASILSFAGVLTYPKADRIQRGRARDAGRTAARGNRCAVSRAGPSSRQAQRAGLCRRHRAQAGRSTRRGIRHCGANHFTKLAGIVAACVALRRGERLHWSILHGLHARRAGTYRARDS